MAIRVYILYSQSLGKYYVGHTGQSMEERLQYHFGNHKGFTSKSKDWQVIHFDSAPSRAAAMYLEKKIKK